MIKLVPVLLLAVGIANGVPEDEKLGVEVLIETLCPDSYRFMRDLSKDFPAVAKYLDLKIIPFGKSQSFNGSSVQFRCQHGARECRGNKIVSCALNRLTDQNAKVQFTYCFMVRYYFKRSDDFSQCAKDAGINIKDVLSCSVSDEATQLQLQMETITKSYPITFIPTIVYNKFTYMSYTMPGVQRGHIVDLRATGLCFREISRRVDRTVHIGWMLGECGLKWFLNTGERHRGRSKIDRASRSPPSQFSSDLQVASLVSFKDTVCDILQKNFGAVPECIS